MFSPGAGSDPALFYLPASRLPPGSARRAGRFCTAAPTRRAAALGARAPAEELAIFLLPPPSHYNPLNLPHGPHALPAADRTVPSRAPGRQLVWIRGAVLRIRTAGTQRAGTGGPSAAPGSGSPPWPWPASSADHHTDPRPDPDRRTRRRAGCSFSVSLA